MIVSIYYGVVIGDEDRYKLLQYYRKETDPEETDPEEDYDELFEYLKKSLPANFKIFSADDHKSHLNQVIICGIETQSDSYYSIIKEIGSEIKESVDQWLKTLPCALSTKPGKIGHVHYGK